MSACNTPLQIDQDRYSKGNILVSTIFQVNISQSRWNHFYSFLYTQLLITKWNFVQACLKDFAKIAHRA